MTQIPALLLTTLILFEIAVLLHAAAHDIAARTIPNASSLVLVGCGLAQRAHANELVGGLAAGSAVFALGLLVWRAGWIGGGDVKLLAASCCLVPPEAVPGLLAAVMIAGGVLAILYLLAARCLARCPPGVSGRTTLSRIARTERWRIRRHAGLPYGVAIATGALLHVVGG